MVFFTCSHCGESIKKPSVAKHYQTTCRNHTPFVTCVDCLKDFKGNEYEAHTKCFTEEERYSAKGFVPKASANKGERKQKAWSECVQGLLSSGKLQQDEKNLLGTISKHDNIPRKKGKFINFLKSTARSFADNSDLIDRVWNKMESYFKEANAAPEKTSDSNNEGVKRKQDEIDEENPEVKKTKKKKHSAEGTEKENNVENGEKAGKNEKKKKKRPSEGEKEEANGVDEPKSKKAKKSKMNGEEKSTENGVAEEENEKAEGNAFDWTETILEILKEGGSKNQIKLTKLQRKVLKKYGEVNGCEVDDKITKKFSKKLNKIDSIEVNGDYVSLKS